MWESAVKANSRVFLAKCARELQRIDEEEGISLTHRSRVHLSRMSRILLQAAVEANPAHDAELLAGHMPRVADDAAGSAVRMEAAKEVLARRNAVEAMIAGIDAGEERREPSADEQRRPLTRDALNRYLADRGLPGRITDISPLWTESSKEITLVDTDGGGGWPHRAVLRRERPYAIVANSVADEFDVLAVVHVAGLPVPRPVFAEHDPAILGGRVIATSHEAGAIGSVASLGDAAVPVVAAAAGFLAKLHDIPYASVPRLTEEARTGVRARMLERITVCAQGWRKARLEAEPALDAAFAWLAANVDKLDDDAAIVHGDFDLRNMLVEQGVLSSVLDWEFAKFGHRAEDLGYFYDRATEVMSWSTFMHHYAQEGGSPIGDFPVLYHRIWAWALRTTIVVNAYTGYWRGAHDDFRLGTCAFYEYPDHIRRLTLALDEAS